MSPKVPQACVPVFLGARSPAVQIFGHLQGIPGQQGGRWAGWRRVSPASGGPCHVMSCPLPQQDLWLHVPLNKLAMELGEGAAAGPGPSWPERSWLQSPLEPEEGPSGGGR